MTQEATDSNQLGRRMARALAPKIHRILEMSTHAADN